MVFTTFKFLVFLIITVFLYYLVPWKLRGYILLAASIVFYCIAGVRFLPFILAAILISYLAGLYISKKNLRLKKLAGIENSGQEKEKIEKKNRCVMWLTILILLGLLAYTKFGGFFARTMESLLKLNPDSLTMYIIVPLGISYYTFSTVGYVLDIYWKRYSAEKNIFKYALYVMYFPHILQGPIARFNRLGVQLFEEHRFDYQRVTFGVQLILWGFIQKLVIADRLGIFVGEVYPNWKEVSGPMLLTATLFYAVQIYTDFAGCVNIARGVSGIFGIELEENFRQPYFSTSVEEFWRRWHMTLGAWFKDYLCMPVAVWKPVKQLSKDIRTKYGRKAGKNTVTICSLIAVWICTGVWHGTGLNYVIWGCWQGGIIIFSTLMDGNYKKMKQTFRVDEKTISWKYFCIARTFLLTGIIPRIITRAPSVGAAAQIMKKICTDFRIWQYVDGTVYKYGLDAPNFWMGIFSIYVLYRVSAAKEKGIQIRETIAEQNILVRWAVYLAALAALLMFGIYGPGYDASSFVYMKF